MDATEKGNWQAVPASVAQLTHGTGSVGVGVVVVGVVVVVTEKSKFNLPVY